MPQDVGQLGNILFDSVKGAGEQLAQIVGENLAGGNAGGYTEGLHLRPDIASIEGLSVAGDEDRAGMDAVFLRVIQKQPFQLSGEQNCAGFAFTGDDKLSASHGLHGEEAQFRHPDAGTADGLQQQAQPGTVSRGLQQAQIFRFGQFLFFRAVGLPLGSDVFHLAVRPAQKTEQTVETGQHGVNGADCVFFVHQIPFVGDHQFLGYRAGACETGEAPDIPEILLHGGRAFFLQDEIFPERLDDFL